MFSNLSVFKHLHSLFQGVKVSGCRLLAMMVYFSKNHMSFFKRILFHSQNQRMHLPSKFPRFERQSHHYLLVKMVAIFIIIIFRYLNKFVAIHRISKCACIRRFSGSNAKAIIIDQSNWQLYNYIYYNNYIHLLKNMHFYPLNQRRPSKFLKFERQERHFPKSASKSCLVKQMKQKIGRMPICNELCFWNR